MKLLPFVKLWASRLYVAGRKWWSHKHADEAAALAFYSLISLVPILLVGIFIASVFVDKKTATDILLSETDMVAGANVGGYFAQILSSEIKLKSSAVSPLLGMLFLLFSATKVIAELRKSLGKVFGASRAKGRKAAMAGVVGRLAAVLMLCVLGIFIASAVVFETLAGVVIGGLSEISILVQLTTYLSPVISFCAITFLTAVAMRWLPARPPRFKEALIGGGVSALLLVALKLGLAQFLRHSNIGSFYGSAVTLVVVLFWIYFAMQVFLYGAELAAVLAGERRALAEGNVDGLSGEDAAVADAGQDSRIQTGEESAGL